MHRSPGAAWPTLAKWGAGHLLRSAHLAGPACHSAPGRSLALRGSCHRGLLLLTPLRREAELQKASATALGSLPSSWTDTDPSVPAVSGEGGDLQGEPGKPHRKLPVATPRSGGHLQSCFPFLPSSPHLPSPHPPPLLPPTPLLPSYHSGIPPLSGCLKELPALRAGPQNEQTQKTTIGKHRKGKEPQRSGLPLSTSNGHSLVLRTVFFASAFQLTSLSPSARTESALEGNACVCMCTCVWARVSHTHMPTAEGGADTGLPPDQLLMWSLYLGRRKSPMERSVPRPPGASVW